MAIRRSGYAGSVGGGLVPGEQKPESQQPDSV
jgi:hypothetical protein